MLACNCLHAYSDNRKPYKLLPITYKQTFISIKTLNQNKKYNGDFHTLLEKLECVKESVNKALRQQQTTTRKRKSSDQREENIAEDNNSTGNPNDTFVDEIDQLSVSEDDVNRK